MNAAKIRRWHSYFGLFIAPSVLFFALTGAAQLFGLHEAHDGYQPPVFLEKLGSLHKDQVLAVHQPHEPSAAEGAAPNADGGAPPPPADDDKPGMSTLLLKWFCLFVAVSLAVSTAFGLWMGLTQTRNKRIAWMLVLAGGLLPAVLLVV